MDNVIPAPLTPGDDLEKQWKTFKWRFQGYIELDNSRTKWSAEKQAKALIQLIGPECAYLVDNATEEERKDVDLLIALITANVLPKTNECFERFLYKQLVRQPQEDVNKFVAKWQSAKKKFPGAG